MKHCFEFSIYQSLIIYSNLFEIHVLEPMILKLLLIFFI